MPYSTENKLHGLKYKVLGIKCIPVSTFSSGKILAAY